MTKMKKIVPEDDEAIDMISYLPKEIIHKIMLLLSTVDYTRMRVLSKTFRSLFQSFPVLDLDCDFSLRSRSFIYRKNWAAELLEFVHNSVRSRDLGQDTLERLTFRAREYWPSIKSIEDRSRIETAVQLLANFALSTGAKELVLDFSEKTVPGLPRALFGSRSIKMMILSGLSLEESVVLDCPSLEYLALVQCCCLGKLIRLASPRLKTAKIRNCVGIEKIEIDTATAAHSLESFSFTKRHPDFNQIFYDGDRHDYERCEVAGLGSCSALKYLQLVGLGLSDNRWFTADVSIHAGLESLVLIDCNAVTRVSGRNRRLKTLDLQRCTAVETIDVVAPNLRDLRLSYVNVTAFPGHFLGLELLESLVLEECDLIEEIVLSSNSLRRLEIKGCNILGTIEIDAPNLVCFYYAGGVFTTPILISANVHADLRLKLAGYNAYGKVFTEFISHLGHSKTLTLECFSSEMLLFPWYIRDSMVSPLYDLQHLSISLARNDILYFEEFVDSLLWLAPNPKTISIALGSDCNVRLEFYYKAGYELHEEDEDDELWCCLSKAIKCWRHHLARVDLEAFPGFREESNLRSFFMTKAQATLTLK